MTIQPENWEINPTFRFSRFSGCLGLALFISIAGAPSAEAQQRPLLTEDPEPISAGQVLIEGGIDLARNQPYPVSGLEGNLIRFPVFGISVGISPIAELQIDAGFFNRLTITDRKTAPLSALLQVTGDHTHDVEDAVIATKVRLLSETARRPAIAFRFATKLPNASNESGLGLDTTDFHASILAAKAVQSVRVVANLGVGILGDPTVGNRQNDVFEYGVSMARGLTDRAEAVAEVNGRASVRAGGAFPGTESSGRLGLGARVTRGAMRFDGGLFVGLTSVGPTLGATIGCTYLFRVFDLP
jgi:hypothetical protein